MKQGDIYFANLNPVKGSEQRGKRPVVIISGNAMNDHLRMCIVCPLSTKVKNYSGCVVINRNKTNNLKNDSEVITFQIRHCSKISCHFHSQSSHYISAFLNHKILKIARYSCGFAQSKCRNLM